MHWQISQMPFNPLSHCHLQYLFPGCVADVWMGLTQHAASKFRRQEIPDWYQGCWQWSLGQWHHSHFKATMTPQGRQLSHGTWAHVDIKINKLRLVWQETCNGRKSRCRFNVTCKFHEGRTMPKLINELQKKGCREQQTAVCQNKSQVLKFGRLISITPQDYHCNFPTACYCSVQKILPVSHGIWRSISGRALRPLRLRSTNLQWSLQKRQLVITRPQW